MSRQKVRRANLLPRALLLYSFLYKNTTFKENFQQDETDKIVYYG